MMCSEISPRVSFSYDLGQPADAIPRRDTTLLDMNPDFEFCIASISDQEYCSADELFANGVILPAHFHETSRQVVQKCAAPPTLSLPPLPPPPSNDTSSKTFQITKLHKDSEDQPQPHQSKSFWGFKRSSSLNCDAKKRLIGSLSLLSRSKSTGSVSSKKSPSKDSQKHQALSSSPYSSSSSSATHPYHSQGKKKNYGNGGKMSSVFNVPPPYISTGTANFFGMGSFLRTPTSSYGSKEKKNKK